MATIHLPRDFKEFLRLLNAHRVEYLLIGGYAVNYHGYPRATADMDIWIAARPANADRVVAGMRAGFRACYNRGLASNPDLQGQVKIVAKVGPNGEVLSATPQGGGGLGAEVVECVVRRVKSASFAPPEGGGATIVIPVTFALQK